ncbi:MAG: hypothetical protein ACYTGB_19925 [Planctomycetota bacterium]|jgi:hypothetical protein
MAKNSRGDPRVELGQVRANLDDAAVILAARIKLTRWLAEEPIDSDNRCRPPRLGAMLSPGKFVSWAVRYAIVRAEQGHRGWPKRILQPPERKKILTGRSAKLCACRVTRSEARAFRRACPDFVETLCEATESINQSKFLTLAVVGFAECVLETAALHNLPLPPWSGHMLFR